MCPWRPRGRRPSSRVGAPVGSRKFDPQLMYTYWSVFLCNRTVRLDDRCDTLLTEWIGMCTGEGFQGIMYMQKMVHNFIGALRRRPEIHQPSLSSLAQWSDTLRGLEDEHDGAAQLETTHFFTPLECMAV
jgi:hypothetical protein